MDIASDDRPFDPEANHPGTVRTAVAFVSTFHPRRCGIASFTGDLVEAVAEAAPQVKALICAVDRDGLDYAGQVHFILRQHHRDDYTVVASRIAAFADVVVIQHEYGLFGGTDGAWIADFADALTGHGVPYIVILHSVLPQPPRGKAAVLRRLCRRAHAVSVFTSDAVAVAAATASIDPARIVVIPHGAPAILARSAGRQAVSELRPQVARLLEQRGGERVVSTFGLVSSGKGLDIAIRAVAKLATRHPRLRYVIAGQTHPEVQAEHGRDYRYELGALADELGVADRVHFWDFFLTEAEIAALLGRTEVFLTPYRAPEQASSGALTFALAAGCPVVSTAFRYAEHMLADGAAVVVDPGDHHAFAAALDSLLSHPERLQSAAAAARRVSSGLLWPTVARRYATLARTAAQAAGHHA
jgi:glycosyltransferase involved in cell wall biosynthesis